MKRHIRRPAAVRLVAVGVAGALPLLTSCDGNHPPATQEETRLVVFAATSLRDAFSRLADDFEKSHAGVKVTFSFAGTQEIRTQLEQGAVADVFASADERHMQALRDAGKVEAARVFVENEPVLVVAREKISSIRSLADLPSAARIVIGAPEVPIGKYTLRILDKESATRGADFRSRVEARVVSRELNVRQVLAKVALGEADAGIVYRSDVASSDAKYGVVTIPAEVNVVARYPIAVVKGAPSPRLANDWLALVGSPEGQAILRDDGFVAPPRAQGSP